MFLVQERSDDSVDGNGLTGSGSTRHKQVRRLGEVEHEYLVGDRSSVGYRQTHLLLVLESFGRQHGVHGHGLRLLVRHFNTDGSFARHRRDDTDTCRREGHHDIVLQRLYLRYTHTGFRHYFIERHGRTNRCLYSINFYAIVAKRGYDTCSVGALFLFVNHRSCLIVIHFEQVERREFVELQVLARVVRTEFLKQLVRVLGIQLLFRCIIDSQLGIGVSVLLGFLSRQRSVTQWFSVLIRSLCNTLNTWNLLR